MGDIIKNDPKEYGWSYFSEVLEINIEDKWEDQNDFFEWFQHNDEGHEGYEYKTLQFHQSLLDGSLKMTGYRREKGCWLKGVAGE